MGMKLIFGIFFVGYFSIASAADLVVPSCMKEANRLLIHLPINLKYDQFGGQKIERVYRKVLHLNCDLTKKNEECSVVEVNLDRLSAGRLGVFDIVLMEEANVMENTRDMVVVRSRENVFVVDFLEQSFTWRVSKEGMSAYGMSPCPRSW